VAVGTPAAVAFTDTGLAPDTAYGYRVVAVDTSGNESEPSAVTLVRTARAPADASLLVSYNFDEIGAAAEITDQSGRGHTGTLEAGSARSALGHTGGAVEFAGGGGGHVRVPNLALGGPGLTVSLWFKVDDFEVFDGRLFSQASGVAASEHRVMLSTITGPRLRFRLQTTDGGTATLIATGATLVEGEWTHAAVTYDGASMRIYQDGVEVGRLAKTGDIVSESSVPLWLGDNPLLAPAPDGAGSIEQSGGKELDGLIDDFRVYDRALSRTELLADMGAPVPPLDLEEPSVPLDVVARGVSPSAVDLAWLASVDDVGVALYRIFRDGVQVGQSATTTYVDGSLTAGTTYTYQVEAVDAAGNRSARSVEVEGSTLAPDETPPSTPAAVAARARSPVAIELEWQASSDDAALAFYRVFRDSVEIARTETTVYLDVDLVADTQYGYQVVAVDSPRAGAHAAAGHRSAGDTDRGRGPRAVVLGGRGPVAAVGRQRGGRLLPCRSRRRGGGSGGG
jgi:chitodextrinase